MVKVSDKDRIEAGNLMEEAGDVFENCTRCGLCKGRCGVFRVLREEHYSPRGHGDMLSQKILDKLLFECNLCKACEEHCPLNLKICDAVLKGREAMVLFGKGLKADIEMVKNTKKNGSPFSC
jgi:Fe-S oxidoreductase